MAKKQKAARVASRVRGASRTAKRKAQGMFGAGKIRWGEAALSALVGFFGGRIMASTPIPAVVAKKYMQEANPNNALNTAYGAMPQYANDPAGWVADETARGLGFLALAKAGYDIVKKGRFEKADIDVGIPFAIGAILSPQTSEQTATGTSGGW